MNILSISSIWIDDETISPEVGPSTKTFNVSSSTKLFLCNGYIEKVNRIMSSTDRQHVLPSGADYLLYLRQLRSIFYMSSTFSLARCFGPFT